MIATIAGHRHEAFKTRLGPGDPADFARLETWKVFAYRGVAADAAAEVAWVEEGLGMLADDDARPAAYRPAVGAPDARP